MPAAISDKFIKQGNGSQPLPAQLSAQKLSGATTASLTAATGWDTSTAKHVRMYQTQVVNGQTVPNQSTLSYYKATLSGTTLSNLTLVWSATGSDQTYPVGATVDLAMTSGWIDDFYAGIIAEHNQDGTHGTALITARTEDTAPDSSADFLLSYDTSALAVKKVRPANVKLFAPQGFLQNGVISRTVATNNITVAIKTLAGSDPSTTDPVYVRIGDTIRTITSALSVTKNAGTNWFNAGASETATQEIDYFTYLGYNATDGVVIGFARIPHARTYGDFSVTTTNDKYCAISTITNATSTDQYEVVGRFNATLSATAAFNWSIPATSVVINRPIFTTRPLVYTPTISSLTGSFTTVSSGAEYTITDKEVFVYAGTTITTNGTAAGGVVNSLPITAASTQTYLGYGRADGVSGKQLQAKANTTTTMSIFNYDGTYPGANGESIRVRYNYKSA